jgi:polysaccharide biosynthesis protein PslH
VLFLTHRAPFPPNRGDRIRSYHILRQLAQHYRVYLGSLIDEPVSQSGSEVLDRLTVKRALVSLGPKVRWASAAWSFARGGSATEGLFASRQLRAWVRATARSVDFDAVVVFCSSMVQHAAVPELAHVPLVVDLVDVDSQKWLDYAAASSGWRKWLFSQEAARVRRVECSLGSRAKAIMLVSQAEAEIYRGFCPNAKTHAVQNGVDLNYFCPDFPVADPRPNQCVFVGVLDYRPNADGLGWFCDQVWPLVRVHRPDAVLAIVGKNPTVAVRKLASRPGVRLVGEVPDVRPFVAQSRFCVAPLRIARGVQNKVLEAMGMGKPVLATPQALEGLRVNPGIDALAASSAHAFAQAACELYSDDRLCRWLGEHGRDYVAARHSWEMCLQPLMRILNVPWKLSGHQAGDEDATDPTASRRLHKIFHLTRTIWRDENVRRGAVVRDR